MATPIPPSPCSSQLTLNTLLQFHLNPLQFPSKNHHKLAKLLCNSCQPTKNTSSHPNDQEPTLFSILRVIPDWADAVKERGMKQKRYLYDHENWVQHRSSFRHVRHFLSSLSSRVILSLIPPVIVFTSVAAIVAGYNTVVSMHWLPEFLPVLSASSLPYQLTAPALALLLVFRTEASYSRFEEGKKAWTKVIAEINHFATMVIASVKSPSDAALKDAILRYIIAFPVALKVEYNIVISGFYVDSDCRRNMKWFRATKMSYCNDSDIAKDLQNMLEVDDLAVVLSSKHHPNCILEFISQSLQLLDMEDSTRHLLVSKLSCFHEGIGVCEQLMGIPIPLSYTQLTSRFLVLWHFTLPIILWDDCHWIVVPATFISAASLFCIEEVGVLIEEPFSMLALDELCYMVQRNVEEAILNEASIQAQVKIKTNRTHAENSWPASLEHTKTS